jgi:hypothetical protein
VVDGVERIVYFPPNMPDAPAQQAVHGEDYQGVVLYAGLYRQPINCVLLELF